mgnify:FL=1|tara:strand:- start:100 stop:1674 length:1575 start_codon:yes stop_codon:yes gene_type:complete
MKKFSALLSALALISLGHPAKAVDYRKAKITRIVDGDAVFIDQSKASIGDSASLGSSLRTGEARAQLLFSPTAIGLMNRNTRILLGDQCFRGEQGSVLVNGRLIACLGSASGRTRLAGSRGTTFVLAKGDDGSTTISVLAGEIVIADSLDALDLDPDAFDIESMYPRVNSSLGLSADVFSFEDPRTSPDGFGSLNVYVPLNQSESQSLVYSYGSVGSDFDQYFNGGVEIGTRWFTPSNQSSTGIFAGYNNYQSSECSNSFLTTGFQWERSRIRLGAAGGFKIDACDLGFSYSQLNLSMPVASLTSRQFVRLNLSPYLLWGNDLVTLNNPRGDNDLGDSTDLAPGGRIGIDLQASDALEIGAYSSYDELYGFVVGGQLRYRLPIGGDFVMDPNKPSDSTLEQISNPDVLVLKAGDKAVFADNGELSAPVSRLASNDIQSLLLEHLKGQDRLPESLLLADLAEQEGVLSTELSGILGIDYDRANSQPLSRTVNAIYGTEFSPAIRYQPSGLSWKTWQRKSQRSNKN